MAAALVAVVVVLAIFAIVKIAGGDPDPNPPPNGNGQSPGPGEDDETGRGDDEREETVEDDLAGIIQRRVGPFRLVEVERAPEFAEAGAAGALTAGYSGPNGGVFHIVAAFGSPQDANQFLVGMTQYLVEEKGNEFVDNGEVILNDEQVGEWALLRGETQIMLWTDGVLFAVAEGAAPNAVDFYSEVPY